MGLVAKQEICSYWSTEPVIATSFFSTCKSRNRFEQVLQILHVVDNAKQPEHEDLQREKLLEICPFLDALTKAWKECYYPKRTLQKMSP